MSFILKLDRAREHLDRLKVEVKAWIDTEPYGIVDEPDPEPPFQSLPQQYVRKRFRVDRVGTIPPIISLLIGDCVFNLRASLDHLAFALAKSHVAKASPSRSLNATEAKGSEFPIIESETSFDLKIEKKKIGCIHPTARVIIKAMQPYHRGNGYATHPLWQIHELNRIDKHRELTICVAHPVARDAQGKGSEAVGIRVVKDANFTHLGYAVSVNSFNLELNAVLFRWAATPFDPSRDMKMNPFLPLEIAFGGEGPMARKPIIPTLLALHDHVRDVVQPALAKYL